MVDESNGSKYMRSLDHKGLGDEGENIWLIQNMHQELKSWGYFGLGEECFDSQERWRASAGCCQTGSGKMLRRKDTP